jgi:hypothetical protein
MDSPSRWPHLFPPRIYELTYRMLEHAVHAEQAALVIIQLSESADTCDLIVDQCIALAAIREGHPRLRQPHCQRPRKLR